MLVGGLMIIVFLNNYFIYMLIWFGLVVLMLVGFGVFVWSGWCDRVVVIGFVDV